MTEEVKVTIECPDHGTRLAAGKGVMVILEKEDGNLLIFSHRFGAETREDLIDAMEASGKFGPNIREVLK